MAKLITESQQHKTLNGIELIKRREKAGMNQAEFAERCGWSAPYQSKLESGSHEVETKIVDMIKAVLGIS